MAIEKIIDITIKGNADDAVGSLKSQLKQAQAEVATLSEKFGVTSVEAANAATKAAELRDRIGDASALTAAFNPDAKFKAVTSSLAGVASGFGAIQSSMALFGAESQDVEKTLLKVQSAMQLTQFLQQSGESIDSFQQLSAVIQSTTTYQKLNTLATTAAAAVQKIFTGAVNTTTTSFNALKTAIVSTGIGALVVGIGYLIAKMNENADATEKLTLEQEQLNKQLEITKKLTDDNAKSIDYDTNIKLANAKKVGASDKELLSIQLDAYEAKGKANAKEIEDIQNTQSKAINLTKEQNKRIQDLREQNLDLQRQGNVSIANLDADLAEKGRQNQKKNKDELAAQKKTDEEELKAQIKKDAEALKAALQAQKDAELIQRQEIIKAIGDAQDKQAEKNLSDSEVEQRVVKDKFFGLIELAKQQNRSKEEIDALEVQRLNELNDIKDKFRLQDDEKTAAKLEKTISDESLSFENRLAAIDTEQELFQKQLDDKLITEEQFNDKVKALSTARLNIDKAEAAAKQALFAKTSQTLNKGADLLGKNTAAGKAMAAAAALINTYQGITAELATKTVTPFEIGLKIANVAIIAATGFKAVKDILSVQVPGGGGGGGGGGAQVGSAPSMTAPSFNTVGSSSTNQLAQTIGQQTQQPIKSYVVSSDVSTAQALDRSIISNASIG